MKTRRCVRGVIGGAAVVGLGASAWGAPTFNVSISDPGNAWSSATRAALVAHAQAAAAALAPSLGGSGSIEILVRTDNSVPRGYGSSVTSSFVRSIEGAGPGGGPMFIFEQAMASELRTGVDPNGAAPDVIIGLNTLYVADVLWLDPQPTVRTAPVPNDRTDAMSVFIHELGHALAYNGWSNGVDDTWPSPGDYRSTWDIHLQFDESEGLFRFAGPYASALYGGPV
ncbi:MAG: hypothetical protein MUE97_07845, partial [Phycisphaerales bacterium]|nr:hypothetical protein [Phycisphaerales bacterium]